MFHWLLRETDRVFVNLVITTPHWEDLRRIRKLVTYVIGNKACKVVYSNFLGLSSRRI